jgi:hypothetical protein
MKLKPAVLIVSMLLALFVSSSLGIGSPKSSTRPPCPIVREVFVTNTVTVLQPVPDIPSVCYQLVAGRRYVFQSKSEGAACWTSRSIGCKASGLTRIVSCPAALKSTEIRMLDVTSKPYVEIQPVNPSCWASSTYTVSGPRLLPVKFSRFSNQP